MTELMTQAVRLEEDTSLEDGTSVAPDLDGSDDKWNQASISRSTEDRTDQLELQQPSSDILASLVVPPREESRIDSAPTQSSSEIMLKIDRQTEESIKEYEPTASLSESKGGVVSSFFTKAKNALAAIIPEPVKEVARSIDRTLSEVVPVWNDIKAWVSDALESICDFLDDLLSEERTETTTGNSSSQSGTITKTYDPQDDINQSGFASVKDQAEQEQSKQELRKALQELFYDILKDRKDAEDLLLNERLKEAINKMLSTVEDSPDKQETENTEHQQKENNLFIDTLKEKQELIEKVAADREIDSKTLMNTSLRELLLENNTRELELFGFTQEQAEALIEVAVGAAQTVEEEHTEPS